jgi:hypothetical protein
VGKTSTAVWYKEKGKLINFSAGQRRSRRIKKSFGPPWGKKLSINCLRRNHAINHFDIPLLLLYWLCALTLTAR